MPTKSTWERNLGATTSEVALILYEDDRNRVATYIDSTLDSLVEHYTQKHLTAADETRKKAMIDVLLAIRIRLTGHRTVDLTIPKETSNE